jgi:hypothetical protein
MNRFLCLQEFKFSPLLVAHYQTVLSIVDFTFLGHRLIFTILIDAVIDTVW